MTAEQWKELLVAWSKDVRATDLVEHLAAKDRDLEYLGFAVASAAKIKKLESRLGVALPPSYRSFLEASDGFRVISAFTYRMRSAADVDWFRVENEGWIEILNEPTMYEPAERVDSPDEEYFDYAHGSELEFRESHLIAMLQVSDNDDGVMLLNPLAVTPDGEWEAWFLASWIPGAYRYASFAHMMVETYRDIRRLEELPGRPTLPIIAAPEPNVPRHHVVEPPALPKPRKEAPKNKKGQSQIDYFGAFLDAMQEEQIAPAPKALRDLLEMVAGSGKKSSDKAFRTLEGKLKGRLMATRHPDLVPRAAELARTLEDPNTRQLCVRLLTEITPDGPAPDWLLAALSDSHPWVQMAAMCAVGYFKGPELVGPTIDILSNAPDFMIVESAATALGEIGDERALPSLVAQLERDQPPDPRLSAELLPATFEQCYTRLALALAVFGPPAIPYLTTLLHHPDRNRRIAAIIGLRVLGDRATGPEVRALEKDSDPGVREQAKISRNFLT